MQKFNSYTGYLSAGGRGTRLNELFYVDPEVGIAKALLEIGKPKTKLIDHHIANLRDQNIEKIVIATGDQSAAYEYVSDTYKDKGIHVTRSREQLGTGGDLVTYARTNDANTPIIVQNVDTILDIDLTHFGNSFSIMQKLGAQACIALTLNKEVPNQGAYVVGTDNKVIHSAEFNDDDEATGTFTPDSYQASSTGAIIISSDFLREQNWSRRDGQLSLYRQTLRQAWQAEKLYAFNNGYNFFRDLGTVATWQKSEDDVEVQSLLRYNTVD